MPHVSTTRFVSFVGGINLASCEISDEICSPGSGRRVWDQEPVSVCVQGPCWFGFGVSIGLRLVGFGGRVWG